MNDAKTNEVGGKFIESRRKVDPSALENMDVDLTELVPSLPAG